MTIAQFRTCVWLCLLLTMGLVAPTLVGCGPTKTSDRDLVLVETDEAMRLVRGQRRIAVLGERTPGAWIDARSASDYRAGHIPGAFHLPPDRVHEDHRELQDFRPLVVYGDDFNSPRANAVSKRLIELGHKDVYTLRGGVRAWKAAGNELVPLDER